MQTVSDPIMARPGRYLNRSHLASQPEQAARVLNQVLDNFHLGVLLCVSSILLDRRGAI